MLYWLVELSDKLSVLNVFRYITFRTGGAVITALVFVFLFGPTIIGRLRSLQGKGQPIRTDGPQSHIIAKAGTPTMGGLMILSGMLVSTLLWANPASVGAALALLGQAPVGPQGRRIAVLGDMLELGPKGKALHRGLAAPVEANAVDLVFCCGPLMQSLWQALPAGRRGGYAEDSAALEAQVVPAIRAGDVVMVKGSLGSRMAPIVKALQRLSVRRDRLATAASA